MTLCDPYQELELYLQEVENEITQAFQNLSSDLRSDNEEPRKKKKLPSATDPCQEELDPFLVQFNATINSDLSELLSRHHNGSQEDEEEDEDQDEEEEEEEEEEQAIKRATVIDVNYERDLGEDDLDALSLDSLLSSVGAADPNNSMDAATQTSPSLSPSSTNLTWASELSSSPRLSSTSDSSSSSIEDDLLTGCSWPWGEKSRARNNVLSVKSSSAPVLKKVPIKVSKQTRSQSDRHLAEIEAAEACKWLRATGFPQYAQMYEDLQFPIDVSTVALDHPLLEQDVLHSLFRRLEILNSCAHLHQQRIVHTQTDDSEEENCALSDNWTYQKDIRRWSRVNPIESPPEESTRQDSQEKDDVFVQCTESPKDKLRRAGSTKFRRRRDGVIVSENGKKIVDSLLGHFANTIKAVELNHVSDSECTPKHTQRSRTKSFDTTDTWFGPQTTNERIVWHKLPHAEEQTSPGERVKAESAGPAVASLSCTQLQVLRKLALLKLTAHMEKYCPSHRTGWNWDLPKLIRKMKTPGYKDKSIFGVPLTITLQRTGQPLPRNIEEALLWLQQNAADQVGLFRKPGVKSRIQTLRNMVDGSSEVVNYSEHQAYDVADMVKQYFRELPETLLTNKLSETFIYIFQYVPAFLRGESVLCALLLMPDEHVQVLQSLLHFLQQIGKHADSNQMTESNLALCFAPSLFHYTQMSFKQNFGAPHPKELADTRAGHDCLCFLLKHTESLFRIPKEFVNQCKSSEFKSSRAVQLEELGRNMGGWREYLAECQNALLKERGRGWIVVAGHSPKVEVSYKKVADGHPLRLWKVSAEVEAPPSEVLRRIMRERHIWDPDLNSAKIVSQIEKNCEIFHYVRRNIVPLPDEEYCVVRTWKTDLPKDACLIVETSIEHRDAIPVPNTVRGIVLASRYLIEPCGSGRSRLIHLSRTDSMGKSPEWYQKNYGHLCALFVSNIVNSFYQNASGPESKV